MKKKMIAKTCPSADAMKEFRRFCHFRYYAPDHLISFVGKMVEAPEFVSPSLLRLD
jgi:hypothetical protein